MDRLTVAVTDPTSYLLSQSSEQGLLLQHRLPLPALGKVLGARVLQPWDGAVGPSGAEAVKGVVFFYSLWLLL